MMDAFGTADVALEADDALEAAQSLLGQGVAVLGGDVFYRTEVGYELAYANWNSEPMPGEDAETYVKRSVQETCEYIRSYPSSPPGKVPLFALVVAQVF